MTDRHSSSDARAQTLPAEAAPWTLAIAASFTVEPLWAPLSWLMQETALGARVQLSPYHQVFQALLSPGSLLNTEGGINVVLVRLEDFVRDLSDAQASTTAIEALTSELFDALVRCSQQTSAPLVVAILPVSPLLATARTASLQAATARLVQQTQATASIHCIAAADIERLCAGEPHDRLREELAHIPFTEEYFAALAIAIARRVHALRVPAHKVLVLDCDHTLWRGVVGEEGVEGIELPEAHLAVQRFAARTRTAGTLVCLTSKNAERDVIEVFERRAEMALKLDDIIAHRINWQSKPENLASLARELNLGLDSFVFLDDNPIECAQMRSQLPQVVTLQLPAEPQIPGFLANLWVFDKVALTGEDARRTSLYRENLARQACEDAAGNIGDFIATLGLHIDIAAPEESQWPRVAQLTQRTNQFNFTTVRRTEAEMRAWAQRSAPLWRVCVRDRFGDYGLVGVMAAEVRTDSLWIDTLLLSCRVLGRGVEHAMLRKLGEAALERGLAYVDLPYRQTTKNEPAQAFADSVASACRLDEEDRVLYRIAVAQACGLQHRPGQDPQALTRARRAEETQAAGAVPVLAAATRSERYSRLAHQYASGRALLEALRAHGRRLRPLPDPPVPPATDSERQLLQVWQEVLNVEGLGVQDNYFALGGTSLLAARLFAEVAQRFGVRLRLTTILDAPTVRGLALQLRRGGTEPREPLVPLKPGGPLQLFLIHDGDGETLLYRNLAHQLPEGIGVWGVEPRALPGIPLAAVSVPQMARTYIGQLRRQQPRGPYLLGGLCAGGVIAYEMARQLQAAGQRVRMVALLDAACPGARQRRGRLARQRSQRFEAMRAQVRRTEGSALLQTLRLLEGTARKAGRLIGWLLRSRLQRLSVRRRFALLRRVLAHQQPWPAGVPPLTVRDIYDCAQARYRAPTLAGAGVTLLRAMRLHGDESDTPYREVYAEESLGWQTVVPDLCVLDAAGGHSSMLQPPHVAALGAALGKLLKDTEAPRARAPRVAAGAGA